MNTYQIEWNNQSYCAADITIFAGKDIADTTLEDALLTHMYAGDKLERQAFAMDDRIAFFILPHEWSLDDEHLVKIVENSY